MHQYFNTPEMSGGTRSYEMARRLVAAGHEVHMVTSYRDGRLDRRGWFNSEEAGIHVHWFPVPYSNTMNFLQRVKAFVSFAIAARSKAIALEGDVVFATSTPLTIALPAVPAARKGKVPLVFEVRDLWPEMPIAMGVLNNPLLRFIAHKLEVWAYRNSNAVVALSPGMKEGVVRTGYPSSSVAVIPNGSDIEEFRPNWKAGTKFRQANSWLGNRPLLLYAGTFGNVNGAGYMVGLAKALLARGSDVRILMVGEGKEWSMVIEDAKNQGVYEKNLFFRKVIPKREMPNLLSAATMASNLVVDIPEARANSANKFFDALAANKPIFLNHGGWMHELVESHDCGLACWRRPIDEVAALVDLRLHDDQWLRAAGERAGALAHSGFDRDKLAQQLQDVLEAAVANNADRAERIAPGIY